jgi:hypothetical protein
MNTRKIGLVTLTLVLDLIQDFNLGYIFWMVCTRTLIFHMSVSSSKTFPWILTYLTLWPRPWCLTYILKTISFEWYVLGVGYFTRVIVVTSPFCGYQQVWPWDVDLLTENFNLGHLFWLLCIRTFIFHMSVPWDKTFLEILITMTLWPWPWCLTYISKSSLWL